MKSLILILKLIFLVCIIVLSFYLRKFLKFHFNSKYREVKYGETSNVEENKNIFQKFKLPKYLRMEYTENKLEKCGNPLHLTAMSYWFLKTLIAVGLFFSSMQIHLLGKSYSANIVTSILFAILGFYIVDIVNYFNNKDDINKIRLDLADVYDLINLQTMAGVNIGHALVEAYTVCKNKRLKKSLIKLAAKINLSKNIERALEDFNNEYNMPEIETFVATIKECVDTGAYEETIDDQSSSLKTVNALYVERQTEKIDMYMLLIDMLMFIGILAVVFFVVASNLMQSTNGIFK
ncbi:type II secretion system F family protein [Clostridium neuense]|uniref:Type II secretion system F family protein n=1 Tax=Clostridium neuense TaxID=1728934 RepID=A0ABW8TGG2_9CLOT